MKTGRYNLKQLFANKEIYKVVVPEIQRDYVWPTEKVTGLLKSIISDYHGYVVGLIPRTDWLPEADLCEPFEVWYREQQFSSNIGFIYAYSDSEIEGKYFLIDGQQRLTTLLLLALALVARNEGVREKFQKTFLVDGELRFEYNVRESAHKFLIQFVQFINQDSDGDVSDQSWYYKHYQSDKTISNLSTNFQTIKSFLDAQDVVEEDFYDYVCNFVLFWYFDTNISEQGEELYIYMNARGESMQDHENIKAELIASLIPSSPLPISCNALGPLNLQKVKDCWAIAWEQWNDIFWKNRNYARNVNSDDGFNEFFFCIAGLENYLNGQKHFISKVDFEKEIKRKQSNVLFDFCLNALKLNGLPKIERYIQSIEYLMTVQHKFKSKYTHCDWLSRSYKVIWDLLNTNKTNWFADLNDPNYGVEHNKMVLLWSVLYYLSTIDLDIVDDDEVFRFVHVLWLRYNNYSRSVNGIKENVNDVILKGVWLATAGISAEEKIKHPYLQSQPLEQLRTIEECIWQIEDHKLNLDGKTKSSNSSHIVNYRSNPTLEHLQHIRRTFFTVFPANVSPTEYRRVQTMLLFYGAYWSRVTPNNYRNFKFNDWERIVRELDGNAFKAFFADCLEQPSFDIEELFRSRVFMFLSTIDEIEKVEKWDDQFRMYAAIIRDRIWNLGDYVHVYWQTHQSPLFTKAVRMFKGGRDERSAYEDICDLLEYKIINKQTLLKKYEPE